MPNWSNPNYLAAFEQLLAALGRRHDRDERFSVFEFSGFGDFSEDHNAYLRDMLGAPGPAPEDSVAALGYYSADRAQNVTSRPFGGWSPRMSTRSPTPNWWSTCPTRKSCVSCSPTTSPRSWPRRSVCLGTNWSWLYWAEEPRSEYVQKKDPLVTELRQRFASAPVITEWCGSTDGRDPRSYCEQALRDVVKYHVSMTSSVNFPEQKSTTPMDPKLYLLWAQANAFGGYRYSVEARPGSESVSDGVCGANPGVVGQYCGRVRLARSGHRQLNAALHRIAVTQIRLDGLGRAYYRTRIDAGASTSEALRSVKRRLARVVFQHLHTDHQTRNQPCQPAAA